MDIEHKAIARIQEAARLSEFYYQSPLLLAYSGGKDSEVCLELCRRARVPFQVIHSHTTIDAPETVYHVRKVFRELEFDGIKCSVKYPVYKGKRVSMWTLIPQKLIPPTRMVRYCCKICKEESTPNRCVVLGVRRYESVGRAAAGVAEQVGKTKRQRVIFDFDNGDERITAPCQMKAEIKIHPIVDWKHNDVWDFLRDAGAEVNPCYSMGFTRVGCVGCPMASNRDRWKEFRQWPRFENLYRRAFARMLRARQDAGRNDSTWRNADDVFHWWMEDKNLDGQLDIFGNEIGGEDPWNQWS